MGKTHDAITAELAAWIAEQKLFFVATAPRADDGHVNLSPKGLDCLRITGPRQVAYLDLTGSGAETIAHVRENGRIALMFCAFAGPPKILRLHGRATVVARSSPGWAQWSARFPPMQGARAVIVVDVARIGDSCGFGVPRMDFVQERDTLARWAENKGPEGLPQYRRERNARSLDGLPALGEEDA